MSERAKPEATADSTVAWRILGLVNEWIRHAETKAVGTLAAAGVSAGVLYNLTRDVSDPSYVLVVVAVLCAACIAGGGLFAAWALKPRLRATEQPTSRLYFHHIARRHPRPTEGDAYLAELQELTGDPAALTADISSQILANAHVATHKFRAGNLGLTLVLAGIVLLGLAATIIAWETR